MEKITVSAIMLTVLLSTALALTFNVQPVEAQTREVGVRVGDWAMYGVTQGYATDDPSPFDGFRLVYSCLRYSYIESFRIEVLSVTGTNITFQVTSHCKNGTEMSNVGWMDVSSSVGPPLPFFTEAVLFVAAGLTVGDQLVSNPMSPSVNATVMQTCVGVEREVNFVIDGTARSMIRASPPKEEYIVDSKTYMFLDRATGVLVEANTTALFHRIELGMGYHQLPGGYVYETESWIQIAMEETNIWSLQVPFWLQWQFYAAVAVVVVVSLGGVVYLLRKRKPRVVTPPSLEGADKISSTGN